MAVTLVQAQTLVTQFNVEYLKHVLNLSNKAIFAIDSEEANEIVFYDSKFNIIKSLAYTGDEYTSEKTEIWERKCTGVAIDYEDEIYGGDLAVDINTPIDSIIKLMGFENYIQENKGDTICIYYADSYNFFEYDTYGSKYPYVVTYIWKSNEAYYFSKCERRYYISYQGDWEITSTTDDNSRIEIIGFDYYDINKSTHFEYEEFTADVFDNDVNTIEYFVPIYELKESRYYYESDRDGDGEIDYKKIVYYAEKIGYDLYSDGIKICRIDFNIDCIYIADGEIYFKQNEYTNENDEYTCTMYIYRYDKQTNAIEQVQEFKSSTIRKNNDIVEIDLGQECDNKCEIIVTSVAGEQCARKQVAAGTRVVNIDTRGFANGIYNFSIMDNGKVVNNGKIIIR